MEKQTTGRALPSVLAEGRGWSLFRLALWGLAQSAVTAASVWLIRRASDGLFVADASSPPPLGIALGFVGLAMLAATLQFLNRTETQSLGQRYVAAVRVVLFRQLLALPLDTLRARRQGHLMLRFLGDLGSLRRWLSHGIAPLTTVFASLLGGVLALAHLHRPLALAVGGVLCLTLLLVLAAGPVLQSRVRLARRRRSQLAGNLGEKFRSAPLIRLGNRAEREVARLAQHNQQLVTALLSETRCATLVRGLPLLCAGLSNGVVLLLGLGAVSSGQTTPGTVIAAMVVTGMLSAPLGALSRVFEHWQRYRVARQKLQSFLDLPAMDGDRFPRLRPGPGHLELARLDLDGVLQDISASMAPGEIILLTGANGAGKSTLLQAIARLRPVAGGAIRLDAQDLAHRDGASVHRAVALASAELPLVQGSVDKNLRYFRAGADAAQVDRICTLCRLQSTLAGLPAGRGTRLREGGQPLTVGQQQRVILARALMARPRLLLLDLADAQLDIEGREALQAVLATRPCGIILATQDARWLSHADRVWYLADGQLREDLPAARVLAGEALAARHLGVTPPQREAGKPG